MTTPTLELNLKASGVQEVKALKAALAELNGEVGKLTAFKNVSALDQLAQEMKGMRDDMKSVMSDIKKVVSEGIKGTFQQAQKDAVQGAQDLNKAFENSMRSLIQTVDKNSQERNAKLAELNGKAAADASKSGEQIGNNFAAGLEKSTAKIRLAYGTVFGGGIKGSASISGLDFGKLDEGIAKLKETPQFAAAAAEAEEAAAQKAEASWAKYAFTTMSRLAALTDAQKAEASERAAAELAEANRAEEAWGKYSFTTMKSVNKLFTEQAAAAVKKAEAEEAAAAKATKSWDEYAYRTTQNLQRVLQEKRDTDAKMALSSVAAQARYQVPIATGQAAGPFSSLSTGDVVSVEKLNSISGALKQFTLTANDAHGAARGLASGFGLLWLTWGQMVPLLAGAALSSAFVQTVKLGADVQNTFKAIEVLAGESADSVAMLETRMMSLARTGPFGPNEIAKAMKILALAGLDAEKTYSAVKDVLNFAVAGDTSIEQAADVMTSVSTAFGVSAQAYSYVGDTIAVAAAASKSSVESMGSAFKTASVINQQYGVSLEDTAVGLSLLANAGIQGTAAGTALRNMYVDLAGRTPKVTQALKELGVQALDPLTGKMREQAVVFKELMSALAQRTPTAQFKYIQDIFSERGGKEAMAILTALRQTAEDTGRAVGSVYEALAEQISEAAGFTTVAAAQMALTPLNQMKSVAATLQTTLVEVFKNLEGPIQEVAQRLKEAFNSEGFKEGLATMVQLVGTLTLFLVEHAKALATVLIGYSALKGVASIIVAITVATETWGKVTAAANTLVGATGRAAAIANPLLTLLATTITLAASAWALYTLWASKGKEATEQAASGTSAKALLDKLQEEETRLLKVAEARSKNISLMQLEAQIGLEKARAEKTPEMLQAENALNANSAAIAKVQGSEYGKTDDGMKGVNRLLSDRVKLQTDLDKATEAHGEELLKIERTVDHIKQLEADTAKAEKERLAAIKNPSGSLEQVKTVKSLRADSDMKTLEADFRQEETLLKSAYSAQMALLDNLHKNKLISEGEYQVRSIQETEAYENKTRAVAEETGVQQLAEYRQRVEEARKISDPAKRDQALANLKNEYTTFSATLMAALEKIDNDARRRIGEGANNALGAVQALDKQSIEYWAKATDGVNKEAALAKARRDLATATDEERAAFEARVKVESSFGDEMRKLQDAYNQATLSVAAFNAVLDQGPPTEEIQRADDQAVAALNAAAARLERAKNAIDQIKGTAVQAAQDEVADKKIQELRNNASQLAKTTAASIVDGLVTGGADGAKKIRDAVKQAFLSPIKVYLQGVMQPIANGLVNMGMNMLGMGNAGSSVMSMFNMGSSANSAMNMFGSGSSMMPVGGVADSVMSAFGIGGSGIAGAATGAETIAATAASTSEGLIAAGASATEAAEASAALASSLEATGAAAGAFGGGLTAAVAAIPVVGWIAAAAMIAYAAFGGKGETRAGGQYGYSFDGSTVQNLRRGTTQGATGVGASYLEGPSGGDPYGRQATQMLNSTVATINTILTGAGSALKLSEFHGGYEASDNDRGGVFVGGSFANGAKFGESGQGDNYAGTLYEKTSSQSPDAKTALENFLTDNKQAVIQAIQAAVGSENSGIPKTLSDMVKGVDAESLSDADAQSLVDSILSIVDAVKQLGEMAAKMPFNNLKGLSFDANASLVTLAGGIGNLQTKLSSFYSDYFTEAEKHAALQSYLTTEFAKLNTAVPKTRSEFKDLVLAQDLTTEAGRNTFNTLLNLSDAFTQLTANANDLTDATKTQAQLDQDVTDARSEVQKAYDTEADRLLSLRDHMQAFSDKLKDFLKELTSGDLSGKTPQQLYDAAKAQFQTYSQNLSSTDPTLRDDALTHIEDAGRALLDASRNMFGASDGYYADLAAVTSAVQDAKTVADAGVDVAKLQLTALDAVVAGLADLRDANAGSLSELYNVSGSGFAAVVAAIQALNGSLGAATSSGGTPSVDTATSAISSYYNQYLGRAPEQAGIDFWLAKYRSGVSLAIIQESIKGSAEATEHNGGVPLRAGLDKVPYDNFPTTLHKDETVLNAAEADKRRRHLADQEDTIVALTARLEKLEKTLETVGDRLVEAQFASTDRAAEKVVDGHREVVEHSGWTKNVREGVKKK